MSDSDGSIAERMKNERCMFFRDLRSHVLAQIDDPALDTEDIREITVYMAENWNRHYRSCPSCRSWAKQQAARIQDGEIHPFGEVPPRKKPQK